MRKARLNIITSLLLSAGTPILAIAQQQPSNTYAKGPVTNYPVLASESKAIALTPPVENTGVITRDTSFMQIDTKLKAAAVRLKEKIKIAKEFIKANNYNQDYCFMVDMSIPSGKKRFYVVNLKNEYPELSSLVSHGGGSYSPGCNDQLVFSNTPNSNATSLGKYKIGAPYMGAYGLSYKLYGLDSTNSNAYERAIVLHSDKCVPETETYPRHIYQSLGCPIVPPSFLEMLGKYIKPSSKPVLLWIYN